MYFTVKNLSHDYPINVNYYMKSNMPTNRLHNNMSRVMRKPTFCMCENKDADQFRGNREADQYLCFRYIDSTIPLLSKSEIPCLYPSSVAVQPGLCRTRSETRTLVFSQQGSCKVFRKLLFLIFLNMQSNVHVPEYTARSQISATFVWQDKSSEKKLSGFMVYK